MYIPERSYEQPEPDFIYGGNGCMHEIYVNEKAFEWDGELVCKDCFRDRINEMSLEEWAAVLDVEIVTVRNARGN